MRKTYQALGNTIAVLVVVQAAAIAWAFFGVNQWVTEEGGVINKAYLENQGDMQFLAEWGFAIHMGYVGSMLIPLLAVVMLIVSFFAKVPGGVMLAAAVVGLVALQMLVLPILSHEVNSIFGALHGVNAFVLMGVAAMAARRAATPRGATSEAPPAAAAV
jgi:hypothetical protein